MPRFFWTHPLSKFNEVAESLFDSVQFISYFSYKLQYSGPFYAKKPGEPSFLSHFVFTSLLTPTNKQVLFICR